MYFNHQWKEKKGITIDILSKKIGKENIYYFYYWNYQYKPNIKLFAKWKINQYYDKEIKNQLENVLDNDKMSKIFFFHPIINMGLI